MKLCSENTALVSQQRNRRWGKEGEKSQQVEDHRISPPLSQTAEAVRNSLYWDCAARFWEQG